MARYYPPNYIPSTETVKPESGPKGPAKTAMTELVARGVIPPTPTLDSGALSRRGSKRTAFLMSVSPQGTS
jgi:hypothetical protein